MAGGVCRYVDTSTYGIACTTVNHFLHTYALNRKTSKRSKRQNSAAARDSKHLLHIILVL